MSEPEEPLGLARGSLHLHESDPRWAEEFEREAARLRASLGTVRIEHIGSTAVAGIAAKPVLDIAIGFPDRSALEIGRQRLTSLGYHDRGDHGADGGVVLAKGPEDRRTHLLHLVEEDDPQWRAYLSFRDLLRGDAALRDEYESVKRALLAPHPGRS